MSEIPLEVILKGPAAIAEWLAARDAKHEDIAKRLSTHQIAILGACGLDPNKANHELSARNFVASMTACLMIAVMISYIIRGDRASARDGLNELMDDAFDETDRKLASPEGSDLWELLQKARKK
jgi:hypothetical protein